MKIMAKIKKETANAVENQTSVKKPKTKPNQKKLVKVVVKNDSVTKPTEGNAALALALKAKQKQNTKKAPLKNGKKVVAKNVPASNSVPVAPKTDGAAAISKKELKAKKKEMLKELKTSAPDSQDKKSIDAPTAKVETVIVTESTEKKKTVAAKKAVKRKSQKAKNVEAKKSKTDLTENEGDDDKKDQKKDGQKTDINSTLFVGNLGQNIKKQHLISLFNDFGEVQSVRIRTALGNTLFKHKTRKETESLIAFVTLDSPESAEKALTLSGVEFRNRHIRVTKANKNEVTSDDSLKRTVFVGNLKYSATEDKLHDLFSSCGEVESVRTMKSAKGCKGVAYVCFKRPEAVGLAMELDETLLNERPIHVERYSKRKLAMKKSSADGEGATTDEKRPKREHKKKALKAGEEGAKKSAYRGVKVGKNKKKQIKNRRPNTNPIQRKLAAKIAPKLQ